MNEREVAAGAIAKVTMEVHDGWVLVRIHGEVDLSNFELIRHELTEIPTNSGTHVIVDVSETDYIDSAGIGLLFDLAKRLRGVAPLAIIAPITCPAGRVLRHVAIDQFVPIYEAHGDVPTPME